MSERATAPRRSPARRLLLLLSLGTVTALGTPDLLLRVGELLLDGLEDRGLGVRLVRLQGTLPGGHRVVGAPVLDVGVGEVVEDDRIFLGEADRALQLGHRLGIVPLLVVRPAKAIDEVAVLRIEVEGALDELHRLREVLAALRVHVADVVVGLRVLWIEDKDATEGGHGVVEATLLLVNHARLEDQVLVLVVEGQALLEGCQGLVVLLSPKVGGAEVEEKLGTLRLEVDRLLEKANGFLVMLGTPQQKGELHPCIDGAWISG